MRTTAEDNTGQYSTEKTPSPRVEIKIIDPAVNRTSAAGLEGRDCTDHATAMDGKITEVTLRTRSRNRDL